MLEVKDALYRGREDLIYRLNVAESPFVTSVYPLGAKRGTQAKIAINGVNLDVESLAIDVPADAPPKLPIELKTGSLAANVMPFAAGDLPEIEEAEPNDAVDAAQSIASPAIINGRIQTEGDVDYFVFDAKAKDRIVLDVMARRLESPLDSIVTLYYRRTQQVAENDDTTDPSEGLITHHADSYVLFEARSDGEYAVRITDVQGRGGEEFAYRLRVSPPQQDFALAVSPAHLRVRQGETVVAKVKAFRTDQFWPEINLEFAGLPEGFATSRAILGKGQSETRFTITAPKDAELAVHWPSVAGTMVFGEDAKTIKRQATPAEEMMQAFYYWHSVPAEELLLAVTEPGPFTFAVELPESGEVEIPQGGTKTVKIKAVRGEQAAHAIRLAAVEPPRGVTVKVAQLPADQDETTITLTANKSLAVGARESVIVSGTLKIDKDNVVSMAPAIPIVIVSSDPPK